MVQWRAGGHCKAAPWQATGLREERGLTGGHTGINNIATLPRKLVNTSKLYILGTTSFRSRSRKIIIKKNANVLFSRFLLIRGGPGRCWRPFPLSSSLLQASEARCDPAPASDWSSRPILASDWSVQARTAPAPAPVWCELSNPRTSLAWPSPRDTYWERDTAWHIPRDTRAPGDKLVTNS